MKNCLQTTSVYIVVVVTVCKSLVSRWKLLTKYEEKRLGIHATFTVVYRFKNRQDESTAYGDVDRLKAFCRILYFFVNAHMWRKWHGDNPCLPTSTWLTNKDDRIPYSPVAAFLYGLRQWYTRSGEPVIMELLEAVDDSDRRGLVNRWLIDNHLPVIRSW
jgi:hypothetical protein